MADYRLHSITWKKVIDYNWLRLQITITPCLDTTEAFPVDHMHQTCLGVMKRLLLLWLRGKIRDFKLSAQNKDQISFKLLQLRKAIPRLFARKSRSLDDI
jgi:hypothetical protein